MPPMPPCKKAWIKHRVGDGKEQPPCMTCIYARFCEEGKHLFELFQVETALRSEEPNP